MFLCFKPTKPQTYTHLSTHTGEPSLINSFLNFASPHSVRDIFENRALPDFFLGNKNNDIVVLSLDAAVLSDDYFNNTGSTNHFSVIFPVTNN